MGRGQGAILKDTQFRLLIQENGGDVMRSVLHLAQVFWPHSRALSPRNVVSNDARRRAPKSPGNAAAPPRQPARSLEPHLRGWRRLQSAASGARGRSGTCERPSSPARLGGRER